MLSFASLPSDTCSATFALRGASAESSTRMEAIMRGKLSQRDITQLHALGDMKNRGILTAEEFQAEKNLLLHSKEVAPNRWVPWILGTALAFVLVLAIIGASSPKLNAQQLGSASVATH